MKCLVTGGAGFIGSHVVDQLIKNGFLVAVIDNLSRGKRTYVHQKARFYKADIRDKTLENIFKAEKPQVVLHYAAQVEVSQSVRDPINDAQINIGGTLNILENCMRVGVKKFIFASSVGVYGEPRKLPVKENDPVNPISPYPIGKLTVEKYLNYYRTRGLQFGVLRYANVYGPRQVSTGEGGVVAIFIEKILKGEPPVIFGKGDQTRDFVYVADAARAALQALLIKKSIVCNIGTNKVISVRKLQKTIAMLLKKPAKSIFAPKRAGEIAHSRVDYSFAKKNLRWEPTYNLSKGLEETTKWFQLKQ